MYKCIRERGLDKKTKRIFFWRKDFRLGRYFGFNFGFGMFFWGGVMYDGPTLQLETGLVLDAVLVGTVCRGKSVASLACVLRILSTM